MSFLRSLFAPRAPLDLTNAEGMARARRIIEAKGGTSLFTQLNALKAGQEPRRGVDYLRAVFFAGQGQWPAALQAIQEELRYFPDHAEAAVFREEIAGKLPPDPLPEDAEFRRLFAVVSPFTMLSVARLWSLYQRAGAVCDRDLPGNFVECGVAGGGSSALLAAVIAARSQRPRRVFACDTFAGMPAPAAEDTHRGQDADATGWGAGTCAAPVASLLEVSRRLGVEAIVTPVQGLFAETLPRQRAAMGAIALLHMDGDWYSSTRDILQNLYDQVAPGAPIQIDDYGFWDGCRRAVEEFARARGREFTLTTIDSTGVWTTK